MDLLWKRTRPESETRKRDPKARPESQTRKPDPKARPESQTRKPDPKARPESQTRKRDSKARPESQTRKRDPKARPGSQTRKPDPKARPESQTRKRDPKARPESQTRKRDPKARPEARPETQTRKRDPKTRPESQTRKRDSKAGPESQTRKRDPKARPGSQTRKPDPKARPESQTRKPDPKARPESQTRKPDPKARPESETRSQTRNPDPKARPEHPERLAGTYHLVSFCIYASRISCKVKQLAKSTPHPQQSKQDVTSDSPCGAPAGPAHTGKAFGEAVLCTGDLLRLICIPGGRSTPLASHLTFDLADARACTSPDLTRNMGESRVKFRPTWDVYQINRSGVSSSLLFPFLNSPYLQTTPTTLPMTNSSPAHSTTQPAGQVTRSPPRARSHCINDLQSLVSSVITLTPAS
ncbi:EZH inhibitory protein-like [Penaeus chinensis]|uniref:EZH inhibitory protein-like n=1 Tax=Penaeus chinensis TaxID=139456 RepID=UPI001FB7D789|nr:EZH inhibitory protein-like [Penaeus chinensis]